MKPALASQNLGAHEANYYTMYNYCIEPRDIANAELLITGFYAAFRLRTSMADARVQDVSVKSSIYIFAHSMLKISLISVNFGIFYVVNVICKNPH